MLDEYIFGLAERISPEAPVIVLQKQSTKAVPGGAANVALNLLALGAETTIVGLIGDDEAGEMLKSALSDSGLTNELIVAHDRVTTRKTRVVADGRHQILRIDHETRSAIATSTESKILEMASRLLQTVDVILFSDYLKGAVTGDVAREIIRLAGTTPVVCNPKPKSLSNYRGATLVSLNKSEASAALDRPVTVEGGLKAAEDLVGLVGCESLLITFGDAGMVAYSRAGGFLIPATRVEVSDPAGAGDTVIATVALGLASIGFKPEVFELASKTAASVVGHVGVATPSLEDLKNLGLSG